MCGRFTLSAKAEEIERRFHAKFTDGVYAPRYNIAPSQKVWTITQDEPENLVAMNWGLKPVWWTHGSRPLINIRSESLEDKPTFQRLLASKRCLIPADGFYEWRHAGSRKEPFHIGLKDSRLFAFAGLWDSVNDKPQLVILTTEPNRLVSRIHDRMPVLLRVKDEGMWLNRKSDVTSLLKVLVPYPAVSMSSHPVSALINSPGYDGPECLS